MTSLFYKVLYWARYLFGSVPLSRLRSPTVYLAAHYVSIALLTGLLAWFSPRLIDPASIDLPFPLIRRFWAGILFLLVYLVIRLVLYLLSLIFSREEPEFADIEAAWAAGQAGLQRHGLDIRWLPTVLVNGLTPGQERNFFEAAHLNWKVVSPPLDDRSAVLRFFANDDGLFICCTGVGATSRQQQRDPIVAPSAESKATSVTGTLRREDLAGMAEAASKGGTLKAVPRFSPQQTMLPPGRSAQALPSSDAPKPPVVSAAPLDHAELEIARRRMRYLCYLLTQDRRPYCPLNGIIQMVPISWAENQRDLAKLCPAPAKDLQEVLESVQMQCPTLLLVTELEQLSGFSDFLERCGKTDSRFVNSRAGSRFPAGAAVDDEHAGWAVERSLHWFRGWVYAILAGDLDNNAGNRRLFRLLCGLSDYRQRLQYLLRHCFEFRKEVSQAVRLSGCYFAATGEGSSRQGFVQGVLLKVLSEQNEVAWSPRRLQRDQRARTWAMILFGVAILLIIGDLTLVGLIVRQNASSLGF